MSGMQSGLDSTNPTVVAAFRAALLHQGLVVLAVLALLVAACAVLRRWAPSQPAVFRAAPEPAWRQLLRTGFGVLWIFDGLLQAQPAMAAGLPAQVVAPASASSPGWVQHVVNWANTGWSYHPVQSAAAVVWIQAGLGIWLIGASRGRWSRLAGVASLGWGLVVWVGGEAFGGLFAPGLTWLFGAPGAVIFYCVAGALIALPERSGRTPWLGRAVMAGLGVFFLGMAVLQAWPGRGFWPSPGPGRASTLAGMIRSMAGTPQPRLFGGWVSGFASFTAAHGFAVNLAAVVLLAVTGAGLLTAGAGLLAGGSGRRWLLRLTVIVTVLFCLADWVLIEDFGFFGGLGTDPNSMIPLILLVVAGYLALVRVAGPAVDAAGAVGGLRAAGPRAAVAAWALVMIVFGAAPLAAAQVSRHADPVLAEAIDGDAAPLDFRAPAFTLTDQYGRPASLATLRGKAVLLTFLDSVCTSDCPLIAQEFRQADQMLGPASRHVELVAIEANPLYRSVGYIRAFDRQENLAGLGNWLYLTGSLAQLRQVWKDYAVQDQILAAGGMIAHSDVAYVIDRGGYTRTELDFDPGPGTASTQSSFAAELTRAANQVLRRS
jgi:cytochrome oxidase Cu insertion factor (SCO1/SenC/PrrC family)